MLQPPLSSFILPVVSALFGKSRAQVDGVSLGLDAWYGGCSHGSATAPVLRVGIAFLGSSAASKVQRFKSVQQFLGALFQGGSFRLAISPFFSCFPVYPGRFLFYSVPFPRSKQQQEPEDGLCRPCCDHQHHPDPCGEGDPLRISAWFSVFQGMSDQHRPRESAGAYRVRPSAQSKKER